MDLGVLLFLALLAAAVYAVTRAVPRSGNRPAAGAIDGPGLFECEIVGEASYQRALNAICGGKCQEGHQLEKLAILILEDDNLHDAKAVRVDVDGRTVGYLSRRLARGYRARLKAQSLPVGNYTCQALIVGGWDRGGGDTGHFGVKLDLPIEE